MDKLSIYISLDRWITKSDEENIEILHKLFSGQDKLITSIIVAVIDARDRGIPELLNHCGNTKFNFIELHDNHRNNPSLRELFGVFDMLDRSNPDYQIIIPRGIKLTEELMDNILNSFDALKVESIIPYFRINSSGTSNILLMKNPGTPLVKYEYLDLIPEESLGADNTLLISRYYFNTK